MSLLHHKFVIVSNDVVVRYFWVHQSSLSSSFKESVMAVVFDICNELSLDLHDCELFELSDINARSLTEIWCDATRDEWAELYESACIE